MTGMHHTVIETLQALASNLHKVRRVHWHNSVNSGPLLVVDTGDWEWRLNHRSRDGDKVLYRNTLIFRSSMQTHSQRDAGAIQARRLKVHLGLPYLPETGAVGFFLDMFKLLGGKLAETTGTPSAAPKPTPYDRVRAMPGHFMSNDYVRRADVLDILASA